MTTYLVSSRPRRSLTGKPELIHLMDSERSPLRKLERMRCGRTIRVRAWWSCGYDGPRLCLRCQQAV